MVLKIKFGIRKRNVGIITLFIVNKDNKLYYFNVFLHFFCFLFFESLKKDFFSNFFEIIFWWLFFIFDFLAWGEGLSAWFTYNLHIESQLYTADPTILCGSCKIERHFYSIYISSTSLAGAPKPKVSLSGPHKCAPAESNSSTAKFSAVTLAVESASTNLELYLGTEGNQSEMQAWSLSSWKKP